MLRNHQFPMNWFRSVPQPMRTSLSLSSVIKLVLLGAAADEDGSCSTMAMITSSIAECRVVPRKSLLEESGILEMTLICLRL